jgi:predicted GNAT superfamily acetyltransferase
LEFRLNIEGHPILVRNAVESDWPAILELNAAEVRQTSHMDAARLEWLVRLSACCKVVTDNGRVVAFLIAMADGAPYENDNYAWFASRFPKFLYVDRVVVDARFARRGFGSMLYHDLFEIARSNGVDVITCEYNIDPPNPASRAFHERFGFRELGTQWVAGGAKRVSLQAADTR